MNRIYAFLGFVWVLTILTSCEEKDPTNEADFFYKQNDAAIQKYIQVNSITTAKDTANVYYYVTATGNPNLQPVNVGDSIALHFTVRILRNDGTLGPVVDSTSEIRNRPDRQLINTNTILPGLEAGLRKLKEGEQATILIPSYRALGTNGTAEIPPFSALLYQVKLVEVKSEKEQIEEYIAKNSLTITTTIADTLYYVRTQEGTPNTFPKKNQEIRATYKGTLLNNTEFDESQDSTFKFRVDVGGVIGGWDKLFLKMNEGEKGMVLIFSKAAYGRNGQRPQGSNIYTIPPYAPLFFEVGHVKSQKQRIKEYITANNITDTTATATGLYMKTTIVGTGTKPGTSSKVKVTYKSYLFDGTEFDNQINKEFDFSKNNTDTLNEGLTAGMKEALLLMKEGEARLLLIPADLAFGDNGKGKVPGFSPVVVEISLVDVL